MKIIHWHFSSETLASFARIEPNRDPCLGLTKLCQRLQRGYRASGLPTVFTVIEAYLMTGIPTSLTVLCRELSYYEISLSGLSQESATPEPIMAIDSFHLMQQFQDVHFSPVAEDLQHTPPATGSSLFPNLFFARIVSNPTMAPMGNIRKRNRDIKPDQLVSK